MRIIFDSEEEREHFCGEFCPSFIGMRDSCARTGYGEECTKCWDAAVGCEVDTSVESKAMVVLETIPDGCNDCPCFNEEHGLCGITKEWYDDYTKKKLDSCPMIIQQPNGELD